MNGNFGIALILIGFVASITFVSHDAYAQFSYGDKIEFTVIIEEIKGHLVAAAQNHIDGNEDLASMHLSHPLEENKAQLDALLKQRQTSENTELVLFMIQNIDTDLANDTFVESTQAANKLLDAIEKSVLGTQDDQIFQLIVINNLLESSKAEYEAGRGDAGIGNILEMQDSHAFAVRANVLFMQITAIPAQDKDDIDAMFVHLFEKHKREESVSAVVESTDQIIDEINKVINGLDHDNSHDGKIPEWIKARVIWWTDHVIDDKTFALGIEFLIKQGIIEVSDPETSDVIVEDTSEIPIWVKHLSKWWTDGAITDNEFLDGIAFLVERGIIVVDRT